MDLTTLLWHLFAVYVLYIGVAYGGVLGAAQNDISGIWSFVAPKLESPPSAVSGNHWAVIVAGSNGYYNYRHQVCSIFI